MCHIRQAKGDMGDQGNEEYDLGIVQRVVYKDTGLLLASALIREHAVQI
jgi:hypothetical protein